MKRCAKTWRTILSTMLAVPLLVAAAGSAQAARWLGPDGRPLPFESHEEAEDFLRHARVVSKETIGKGINHPQKLLLELDGVQAHAIFRDVSIEKKGARFRGGDYEAHFRDSALLEVAAYRLSRLLDLEGIPPTVERKLGMRKGSVQLWIESAVDERERLDRDVRPADLARWRVQMQNLYFFDNLIANSDRNQGNMLLDTAGRLWMIDHTRTFRRDRELKSPTSFWQVERRVWLRLLGLDRDTLERELRPYLHYKEMEALWTRRDLLVEKFRRLIQERGEGLVLLDAPETPAHRAASSTDPPPLAASLHLP